MPPSISPVSDAELEVLKVLWKRGAGTVREVEAGLRRKKEPWAYTTILTLLTRLRAKGCVESEKGGGGVLIFRAKATRQDLLGRGVAELAARIGDGTAAPLVHALVKKQKFTPQEIADLRKLLDELEGKE